MQERILLEIVTDILIVIPTVVRLFARRMIAGAFHKDFY